MVNKAAGLLQKWFDEPVLGMCRIVNFGGVKDRQNVMQPSMFYDTINKKGELRQYCSTLSETSLWVANAKKNL